MSPSPARRPSSRRRTSPPTTGVPAPPPRAFIAHHLVPPHELLSEEETRRTLEALGTSLERLPKILVTDPGLKTDPQFVAARQAREPLQGRLVRIRRPSATAGEALAYRVILHSFGE